MQPFHFTLDPFSAPITWSKIINAASQNWTIDAGTELKGQNVALEGLIVRDTDMVDEADVQARIKRVGSVEYGIIANFQDNNDYYLWLAQTSLGRFGLFRKFTGGFTLLGTHVVTPPDNTFQVMRLETINEGANKRLNCYLDGIQVISVATAIKFGAGRAGIRMFGFAESGPTHIDWFTFNTALGISSVVPNSGKFDVVTPVVITGTDFGEGMLVDVGAQALQGAVVTPSTSISGNVPTVVAPVQVNVVAKFGTPGSEEFTTTLVNGYEYLATSVEAVNIDILNITGDPVVGRLVSVFDLANVLQDSGLTDSNGRFATNLPGSPGGIQYRVIATGDGIAGGNSQLITVVGS